MGSVKEKDVQRLFLQAMLSRRVVPVKLAKVIWVRCIEVVKEVGDLGIEVPETRDQGRWDAFVNSINESLNSLDLEFRHINDEETGAVMFAIVNRKGDEIAQAATDYTAVEIAYFKAVVEQIMLAPNEAFSVSSLLALREVSSLKANMSKTQAEVVLESFVAKGWLSKSQRGRYSLSTRALLELGAYLRSTYPDEVLECTICYEILTRGVACYIVHCKARLHPHCYATYCNRQNQALKCPSCSNPWIDGQLKAVGEAAARDGNGKRQVRRREGNDSEDDPDETMDDSQQTQTQTQTQRKVKKEKAPKKRKGKGRRDEDEDEDEDEGDEPDYTQRTQPRRSLRKK